MTNTKAQRWPIWLIAGLPVLVMVLARVLVPSNEGQRNQLLDFLGTRNNGVLIEPAKAVSAAKLVTRDGARWQFTPENTRWKLVVAEGEGCHVECQQSLYITRQIHKLMPKRSDRLERIYVGRETPSKDMDEVFAREYPGVSVLFDAELEFDRLLDEAGVPKKRTGFYYLLDSRGYLVMYYTSQHSHKQVITDLKILL